MKDKLMIGAIIVAFFPMFVAYNTNMSEKLNKKADKDIVDSFIAKETTRESDIKALMVGYGKLTVENKKIQEEIRDLKVEVKDLYKR